MSGMKYTVAGGGATLDGEISTSTTTQSLVDASIPADGIPDVIETTTTTSKVNFNADKHYFLSFLVKASDWRLGLEYILSDADEEDTAYVLHFRYKLNKKMGLRLYYYHVEANATLADGLFTQDNFGSAQNAADNFEGPACNWIINWAARYPWISVTTTQPLLLKA